MPLKKKPEPSKKHEQKKKEKIIEDKTFGMKNKKGAKSQKYIQQVQQQVQHGNQSSNKSEALITTGRNKEEKKKEADEFNALFKPMATQKVDKGVDPKSVLCAFYKQGQCAKGGKCKFSHDLSLERKSEKRNIYVDARDSEDDDMENWDEVKLKEVIEKKHGAEEKKMPKTDIICKYFLDALENNKYGWRWECPNGANKCHYRHALPQGFVLKKKLNKQDRKEEVSIEDLVERQRAELGHNLKRITFETFLAWKRKKSDEKKKKEKKEEDRRRAEFKIGRSAGLSGRDMFTFHPELAVEDALGEGEVVFDVRTVGFGENKSCDEINRVPKEWIAVPVDTIGDVGTVACVRHWEKDKTTGDLSRQSEETVPFDENLFQDDLDDLKQQLEEFSVE